jgi:hypothetical protein
MKTTNKIHRSTSYCRHTAQACLRESFRIDGVNQSDWTFALVVIVRGSFLVYLKLQVHNHN